MSPAAPISSTAACSANPEVSSVPNRGEESADSVRADGTNYRQGRSYQKLLRAIGAFFDDSGAEGISVIEAGAGFIARFYAAETGAQMQSRRFSTELLMRDEHAAGRRSQTGDEGTRREDSYENVLRTLGWELDDVAAGTITVDQLSSQFYVSWLARSPEEGLVVVKRHATVGTDALTLMLNDAEGRRRSGVLKTEAPGGEGAVPAQGTS